MWAAKMALDRPVVAAPAAYAALRDAFGQAQDYARSPKDFGGSRKRVPREAPGTPGAAARPRRQDALVGSCRALQRIASALALKSDYPHLQSCCRRSGGMDACAKPSPLLHVPVIAAGLSDLPEAFSGWPRPSRTSACSTGPASSWLFDHQHDRSRPNKGVSTNRRVISWHRPAAGHDRVGLGDVRSPPSLRARRSR